MAGLANCSGAMLPEGSSPAAAGESLPLVRGFFTRTRKSFSSSIPRSYGDSGTARNTRPTRYL